MVSIQYVWIGLDKSPAVTTDSGWVWRDNTTTYLSWTNWDVFTGEPNQEATSHCVRGKVDEINDQLLWRTTKCSSPYAFLCQIPTGNTTSGKTVH